MACVCVYAERLQPIDSATRSAIALVANIVGILAQFYVPISDVIIVQAYDWATENDYAAKDLLQVDVAETMVLAVNMM